MKKLLYAISVSLLLLVTPNPAAADRSRAPLKQAATLTVTNLLDPGAEGCTASDCSLRAAITAANADGVDSVITFSGGLTGGTITLASPLPAITEAHLTVITVLSAGGITISGAGLHQILTINAGTTVGLKYLTFSDANSTTSGGAIYNAGTLTIQYCVFERNQSTGDGGAIYNATPGVVDMNVVILDGNKGSHGGAISNASSVDNSGAGTMNIDFTWLQGNEATGEGGAIYNTGGDHTSLHLYKGFFSYNKSGSNGGGVYQGSGAMMIENSTFTSNSAVNGAAFYNGSGGALSVRNNTIYGNSASAGSSVHNGSGSLDLRNTIVANQLKGTNCSGAITNAGNNIDSLTSCGWGSVNGSFSNTDPLLGPLWDYAGATRTMRPYSYSPAVDGVVYNPLDCPVVDQRGHPRPFDGNFDGTALCDIGAHELDEHLSLVFLPFLLR